MPIYLQCYVFNSLYPHFHGRYPQAIRRIYSPFRKCSLPLTYYYFVVLQPEFKIIFFLTQLHTVKAPQMRKWRTILLE